MNVNDFYSAEFANNEATKNKERIYNDKLKTIFQQFINRSVEKGKFSVDIPEMYIDEHYMEKLSLKNISEALGIGTTKLCSLAKKLSPDGSITKLISIRRVEAAKTLLLKENLSIAEIAEKVGFSDYNYFTKIFKKIMDCTPSEYRKLKNK